MKTLLHSLCISLLSLSASAAIQQTSSNPITFQISGPEAAPLLAGLKQMVNTNANQISVNNLQCHNGIDFGKTSCMAGPVDARFFHVEGAVADQIKAAISSAAHVVYANPANRIDPQYDQLQTKSVTCQAGSCTIVFGFGGGAI